MKYIVIICLMALVIGTVFTTGCLMDIPNKFFVELKAKIDMFLNPSQGSLDAANNAVDAINKATDTIDKQPGLWGDEGSRLINELEDSGNEIARKAAIQVKAASSEILGATTGDIQCRGDSVGVRFSTYLKRIRYDIETDYDLPHKGPRPMPEPVICHFSVDTSGSPLTYIDKSTSFVNYYGYDFSEFAGQKQFSTAIVYGNDEEVITFEGAVSKADNYHLIADITKITNNNTFWNSLEKRSPKLRLKWGGEYVSMDDINTTRYSEIPLKGFIPSPVPKFSATPTAGIVPLTVKFKDESSDATEWEWDFGDDGKAYTQNPSYTYINPGEYKVLLKVSNADNPNKNPTIQKIITVKPKPLPICQIKTIQVTPTYCEFIPPHKAKPGYAKGNTDFDGKANLWIQACGGHIIDGVVYAALWMEADEGRSDWTYAAGWKNDPLDNENGIGDKEKGCVLYTPEPGWKVIDISPNMCVEWRFNQVGNKAIYAPPSGVFSDNNQIIAKMIVAGDTAVHEDAGENTMVRVYWKEMTVTLQETENCRPSPHVQLVTTTATPISRYTGYNY